MARYQASLSAHDQLTLRLIWRYHCAGVLLPSVLCRWGDSATAAHVIASVVVTDDTSSNSSSSGTMAKPAKAAVWLQECVNARRVRQSLEAFPIDRPLVPAALPCEHTPATTTTATNTATSTATASNTTASSTATAMLVDSDNGAEGETDVESGDDDVSEAGSEEDVQGDGEVAAEVTRQEERGALEVAQCPTAVDKAVAAAVYDPCFLLPLLESTLRTGGVTARQVHLLVILHGSISIYITAWIVFICYWHSVQYKLKLATH
jgi:hypothetical protein